MMMRDSLLWLKRITIATAVMLPVAVYVTATSTEPELLDRLWDGFLILMIFPLLGLALTYVYVQLKLLRIAVNWIVALPKRVITLIIGGRVADESRSDEKR